MKCKKKDLIMMSAAAVRQKALDIKMGRIKIEWLEDPEINRFINGLLDLTTK